MAEMVDVPPPLWPALAVGICAICAAVVLSGIVILVAAVTTHGMESLRGPQAFQDWLAEFVNTRLGLALLVLPGQLSFAAAAFGAAAFSREGWLDRLGFRAGRISPWTWWLFLLGTPVVGILSSQLMTMFSAEPSEQLKMFDQLFRHHSASSLALLLLLISVIPGVVEEVLFRGYMQRRLLKRLPAAASIGICSVFFAAAHMDPVHAVGVLPLGVWLGVLAWRADSIWPAILGHIGNNAFAVVMPLLVGQNGSLEEIDPQTISPAVWAVLGVTLMSFVASIFVLIAAVREPTRLAEDAERTAVVRVVSGRR